MHMTEPAELIKRFFHHPSHPSNFTTVPFCGPIHSVTYVFKLSDAITLKGFCKRSRSPVQSAHLRSQYVALRGHRHVTRPNKNKLYGQYDVQLVVELCLQKFLTCQSLSVIPQVIRLFNLMVNWLSTIPHMTLVFTIDS